MKSILALVYLFNVSWLPFSSYGMNTEGTCSLDIYLQVSGKLKLFWGECYERTLETSKICHWKVQR